MGYDLHITRRNHWPNNGRDITAEEWLGYVQRDAELRLQPENGPYFAEWRSASGNSWLDWSDGQIYTKNPEPKVIDKMVAIARHFNARVQGDDGEIYEAGGQPPRPPARGPAPSWGKRLAAWFSCLLAPRTARIERRPLPFGVGDRVRDPWGYEHTVIGIDPKAEHGMGVIRTRRSDGTEHKHALTAHGFEPLT